MTTVSIQHQRRVRRWGFRLAAMLLPLGVLALTEGVLWLGGWGEADPGVDPFVGFSSVIPLFEKTADGSNFEISSRRREFFARDSFPVHKQERTFRVFVFGESTVQGNPYSIETSFPTWLRLALQTADPSQKWEVVNCGGVSYASYRLVPILKECLNYQPDLLILCVGHNEFLEDRTYRHVVRWPRAVEQPVAWLAERRLVTIGRMLAARWQLVPDPVPLKTEVDPMLDYQNGLAAFHRDGETAEGIAAHYEANLERMVELADAGKVPLILMRPASNLIGCPPFKQEQDPDVPEEDRARAMTLHDEAQDLYSSNLTSAIKRLQQARELDPRNPILCYELGQCLAATGNVSEARKALIEARDLDVCPLRMTTPLEEALDRVAERGGVPLLNVHELLERETRQGILGGYWLVDHVHPSFEGHQRIAIALLETMQSMRLVSPQAVWKGDCRSVWQTHFESLNRRYFHEGNRKLALLREWAKGNADGPPAEHRFPERITSTVPPR